MLNHSRFEQLHSIKELKSIPPGCIVQWDAHFGANECGIPRDSVMLNPHLELLNYFQPDTPAYTLGGNLYEILFFLVLDHDWKTDNYALMDSFRSEKEKLFMHKILLMYDFEKKSKGFDTLKLSMERAYSGSHSFRIDKKTEFGPVLEIKCSAISSQKNNISIRPSAFIFLPASLQSGKVHFVVSLEEKYKPYQYETLHLNDLNLKVNQWNKISFTVLLHEIKSGDNILKVYLWNQGKKELFLDDFRVEALIPIESPGK
jgi:hypothetical protein